MGLAFINKKGHKSFERKRILPDGLNTACDLKAIFTKREKIFVI